MDICLDCEDELATMFWDDDATTEPVEVPVCASCFRTRERSAERQAREDADRDDERRSVRGATDLQMETF